MTAIAKLFLMTDSTPQKYVFDSQGLYSIGRGKECCLTIPREIDSSISRIHCKILLTDSAVYLRDTGSSNGTYLNKIQLDANIDTKDSTNIESGDKEIYTGDIIQVGNSFFNVEIKIEATADSQDLTRDPNDPKLVVTKNDTVILTASGPAKPSHKPKKTAPKPSKNNGFQVLPKKKKSNPLIKIN